MRRDSKARTASYRLSSIQYFVELNKSILPGLTNKEYATLTNKDSASSQSMSQNAYVNGIQNEFTNNIVIPTQPDSTVWAIPKVRHVPRIEVHYRHIAPISFVHWTQSGKVKYRNVSDMLPSIFSISISLPVIE